MTFNVKDFGGVGNGKSLETSAIQKAVDACHERGGGIVFLSGGTYLSGTITLRSNVVLYIDSSAKLLGSSDRAPPLGFARCFCCLPTIQLITLPSIVI